MLANDQERFLHFQARLSLKTVGFLYGIENNCIGIVDPMKTDLRDTLSEGLNGIIRLIKSSRMWI